MQEIRRHLMIKRPQFLDNEEKLADAEETRSSHKTHHHAPKHASRHHKKHDKITHTTTDFTVNTTTESVTKINTTPRNEKGSTTEEKSDKYSTTPIEISTMETIGETSATAILTSVKPKKSPRRQKIKETPTNRTEIEEDKPQRRRKVHHHRRNNTLLTNSVHDDILRVTHVNTTYVTDDVTLSTQNPTTRERHNYSHKFTTPATIEASSMRQEIQYSGVSRNNNDFNEDHTTESIAITESGTTVMTSTHVTEVPRINSVIDKSFDQSRNSSVIFPTTVSSVKRYPKVQKNRTSGILGPARIDVTILESPDRKHKQGIVINVN